MVSNVLEVDQDDLLKQVKTFKKKYADDPDYKKLRAVLPKDWPLWDEIFEAPQLDGGGRSTRPKVHGEGESGAGREQGGGDHNRSDHIRSYAPRIADRAVGVRLRE